MKKRIIDLFCGIGGFRIGFHNNGFETVFSSDFNKHVQETYNDNYGELPFGDITKINPKDVPDFDVLCGGFPCQPFSISGKKLGFEDTRGTLFFDICKIINEKKPKVVVLENVKHLINHDKKRTLKVIIETLVELGYNVTHKLLNTQDYGLPQNRERIFIVGSKKGYFDFEQMEETKSLSLENFLDEEGDFQFLDSSEYTLLEKGVYKKQPDSGLIFRGYRNKNGFKKGVRPNSLHLNRSHRQPNRIYSIKGYHPTLPSQESSGRFFIYDYRIDKVRKLTIRECYRIMGFPENFKLNSRVGERYKQIGNSVGVNVVQELSRQILKQGLLNYESKRNIIGDLQLLNHI